MAYYDEVNDTLEMDANEDVPKHIDVYDNCGEFVARYVPERLNGSTKNLEDNKEY